VSIDQVSEDFEDENGLDDFEGFKEYNFDPFAGYSDPPAAEHAEEDRPDIRQLREQWSHEAKRSKEAEAAHAALLREVSFIKAGIDVTSKLGAFLLKADVSLEEIVENRAAYGLPEPK
jgi:hypothetical protein